MMIRRPKRIVVLGIMSRHPVAGVVWQTLHYLLGLRLLGHDPWYVEAGAHQPSSLLDGEGTRTPSDDRSRAAAAFLDRTLGRFDLDGRWAFHALHADSRCYGLSESRLMELYRSADLLINLHGATIPRPEHAATGRLVYLETDPVWIQIGLFEGREGMAEYLAPHRVFFTFGENYGAPGCRLPVTGQFRFHPTRQPVVLDLWDPGRDPPGSAWTTVGNWKQTWRDITWEGEVFRWSKHHEFRKFLGLPERTGRQFELALSPRGCGPADLERLARAGWKVRNALDISREPDAYRRYIQASRGEFTVGKEQNVRFRTGWFSDRSATYLAAGRPVITQDTGFGDRLPTGDGLFPFTTMDDIVQALDRIESDYAHHSRAARTLARDHFAHDVVLPRLLQDAGL